MNFIQHRIRTIPDHPKPGILFRDITTLLHDQAGLRATVDQLAERYRQAQIAQVMGIEARGFIIGAPLAYALGAGFIPIRKPGKLPGTVIGQDYALEYGHDRIEIHQDAVSAGERVLLVDDLLATGGTLLAATRLVQQLGVQIVGCAVVIDLPDLGGRHRLEQAGQVVFSLCAFEGK